jgi:site-specific recombinase XerD
MDVFLVQESPMGIYHDKLVEEVELRGFSNNTKIAYVHAMKEFIKFHQKSPDKLGVNEIKKYQHFLVKTKKLKPRSINQQTAAIKFFYKSVLKRYWHEHAIPRMKTPKKIPVTLTSEEIKKILSITINIKHKAMLMALYSSGIRISELLNLKSSDIDSKRMIINIKNGKGGKDRQAILSPHLLECLREYWKKDKEDKTIWLFPSSIQRVSKNKNNQNILKKTKKFSAKGVHLIVKNYAKLAMLKKNISAHSFRHSFAVHLLDNGANLRHIQYLLGHSNISSTVIYTYIADITKIQVKSPLDLILKEIK